MIGRVGVSRRDGNRRYYDLIERLVPEDVLKQSETAEEGQLHRLLSRYRAVGLTSPSAPAELMVGTGQGARATAAHRRARRTWRAHAGGGRGAEGQPLHPVGGGRQRWRQSADEPTESTTPASPSSRRLTRSCGTADCCASCGTSTTSGRSTCPRPSAAGATTCCRSSSATGSSGASSHVVDRARRDSLRSPRHLVGARLLARVRPRASCPAMRAALRRLPRLRRGQENRMDAIFDARRQTVRDTESSAWEQEPMNGFRGAVMASASVDRVACTAASQAARQRRSTTSTATAS